jgi:adhesin transport system membrane fusion protein
MSGSRDFRALSREMRGHSGFRGSLLLFTIITLLIAIIFWASVTEIDDVTRADGRVVPIGDVQIIEASENGILKALHVSEGDIVDTGFVLMELDGVQLTSQLDQERQRAYGLMARIERLDAEISESDLIFTEKLIVLAPDVVKAEAALYRGKLDALSTEIAILEDQRHQRSQQHLEEMVSLDTATQTLSLLVEEITLIEPLVDRGIEPRTTLLTLRRNEAEWIGRQMQARAALSRLVSATDEIDGKILAQKRRYIADSLTEQAIATAELAALKPMLPALEQRAQRAQIKSPIRGVINRIHRTTIGSMAKAGEEIIEIVPLDDSLLIEAFVQPKDIAFLYTGQPVKVKITAYDFARYGSLDGKVIRIGADTVQRSERDNEEVFVAKIRTDSNILDGAGDIVQIMPGMIAQVDILADRKTVLDYLIEPVIKVKSQAFRD